MNSIKNIGKRAGWPLYTFLTVLCWGAWGLESKLVVDRTSAYTVQILFTAGLILPVLAVLNSRRRFSGTNRKLGLLYAIITGLLGGIGNVLFYEALKLGRTSDVVPFTSLFPIITVILAAFILRENISRYQYLGLGLALGAIFLLSL